VIGGVCAVFHGPRGHVRPRCLLPFRRGKRPPESAVQDLHPFHRLTANKLPLASKEAAGRERDLLTVRFLLSIKERKEQQKNLL
jgi:hypothetical protein